MMVVAALSSATCTCDLCTEPAVAYVAIRDNRSELLCAICAGLKIRSTWGELVRHVHALRPADPPESNSGPAATGAP